MFDSQIIYLPDTPPVGQPDTQAWDSPSAQTWGPAGVQGESPLAVQTGDPPGAPAGTPERPLEILESEICELAGHLAAATARFLVLLAEFDAREGWASWDMPSCAAWLSWKCQLSSGTAREHVRVARALRSLPRIRGEFAAGRLSYAKARALTRIATPDTDADLAEMAHPMTANQLERFTRAHRSVTRAQAEHARIVRRLTWRLEEDGSFTLTAHLPPEDGAAVLTALRAAIQDTPLAEEPHDDQQHPDPATGRRQGDPGGSPPTAGVPARTRRHDQPAEPGQAKSATGHGEQPGQAGQSWVPAQAGQEGVPAGTWPDGDEAEGWPGDEAEGTSPGSGRPTSTSLADALVEIAEAYVSGLAAQAENPDVYQVVVHADPAALAGDETARSHVEDGPAISPAALQRIACNAVLRWMSHDQQGNVLDVGRRRRQPTPALRQALRERDKCRCRFPGCHRRSTEAHHIWWWMHGGPTSLDNLISLCRQHHNLIHQHGYTIITTTTAPDGFTFHRPDGNPIPHSPPLPTPTGPFAGTHDAEITPTTIVPPWYGERLDLDYAIAVLFGNQRVRRERAEAAQQLA